MNPAQAGRVLREVRRRQGKRLSDVAAAAGCSASTVSRVERGDWDRIAYGRLTAVAEALEVRLETVASWHGAERDRVLDEGHARLLGGAAQLVGRWGWITHVEVTYSVFGERGSIDLLAWHPETATLVVFEIKTELGSVEGLLRPLNAKVRLAVRIARQQFGFRAARVGAIVVFPESRAVRRMVDRHSAVIGAALPARSRETRAWLRQPSGALRGCWFLSISLPVAASRNPSSVRRVRVPRPAPH